MAKSYLEATGVDTVFSDALNKFVNLAEQLQDLDMLNQEHGQIESMLHTEGMEMLRLMLQAHLDLRTESEELKTDIEGSDGVVRTHLRKDVVRKLSSLFGQVETRRISYSAKNRQALYPQDMVLNLGSSRYTDGLCRRVAEEASKVSFDECVNSIKTSTGGHVPKRQCEQIVAQVAQDFESYYDSTVELEEETNSNLLVITTDSKGIVMRTEDLRPATRKAAEHAPKTKVRLSPGEKKNRKRMATAAAVYSADPLVRLPEEIMDSSIEKPKRPKVENKRVWASVERGQQSVISEAVQEALGRDPDRQREWVVVVDGEVKQIDHIKRNLSKEGCTATIVLDFIHVLEYLWKASYCFHDVGSSEAEQWVQEKALGVLKGNSSDVAAGMRRSATRQNLSQNSRTAVDKCADYLLNNRPYLTYNIFLEKGYPIASGVIEGACRHLINDRLAITGSRWGLKTAESILKIRSMRSSGDFEEYWIYHKAKECERNHLEKYARPVKNLAA